MFDPEATNLDMGIMRTLLIDNPMPRAGIAIELDWPIHRVDWIITQTRNLNREGEISFTYAPIRPNGDVVLIDPDAPHLFPRAEQSISFGKTRTRKTLVTLSSQVDLMTYCLRALNLPANDMERSNHYVQTALMSMQDIA